MGDEGTQDEQAGRPRWGRRLAVGAAVVVVGVLLYSAYDWYRARLVWPAEMPELVAPAPVMPPAAEGEAALAAAVGQREALAAGVEARSVLLAAEGAPAAPADGWPEDVAAAEAAVDGLVALSGLQIAPVRLDGPSPDFLTVMRLGELRQVRALRRFVEGDGAGAWGDVASAVRLGQLVQHAGGSLLAAMVGVAIEEGALRTAGRLLAAGGWDPAARALLAELTAAAGRPSPLVGATAGECAGADAVYAELGTKTFEELMATAEVGGRARAGGLAGPAEGAGGERAGARRSVEAGGTWLYDADATRALWRQHCAALVAAMAQPASTRVVPVFPEVHSGAWWRVGELLDNPIGRLLLSISVADWSRFAGRVDRLAALRARVQVALATAGWTAEQGSAPSSIEALVPGWLPAVPVDALSGAPLTLDPAPLPEEE
ncbi:MAG: hypothetical protein H6703_12305 [Myxococcales bacterium]|nr:hypothetical protein [Myxococcales bacterium]